MAQVWRVQILRQVFFLALQGGAGYSYFKAWSHVQVPCSLLLSPLTNVQTIALLGYVYIVDFPERPIQSWAPKFLTPDEAQYFVARIEQDRQDAVLEPYVNAFVSHVNQKKFDY